jgi:TusA-related sulfurtransferase
MERLSTGNTLKVISDDPQSEEDISRWVHRSGHELVSIDKKKGDIEFIIKKAK